MGFVEDMSPQGDRAASLLMSSMFLVEMLSTRDEPEFARNLCEQMRELTGAQTTAFLRTREGARPELRYVCPRRRFDSLGAEQLPLLYRPRGGKEMAPLWMLEDRLPEDDPWRAHLRAANIESLFIQPLTTRGETLGILCLVNFPQPKRQEEVVGMVGALAPVVTMALDNLLTRAELEEGRLRLEARVEERTQELAQALDQSRRAEASLAAMAEDLNRSNRALEESTKQAERYLQVSAEIIISLNREGVVTLLNESGHRILGYPRGELIGQDWFSVALPAEERERVRQVFRALMQGGPGVQEHARVENAVVTRSGEQRFIRWYNTVLFDDEGRPTGLLSSGQDFTEEKRQDDERRALEEQFLQAQKMESIGLVAGGVAHDFNNLLQGIIGYAEIVSEKVEGDEEIEADLREVLGAAQRASELTGQLLAFSRRQKLKFALVDLQDIIRGMRKMLGRVVPETIQVEVLLGDRPMRINADRGRIEQVILNLCLNARDAMPDGGVLCISTFPFRATREFCFRNREVDVGDSYVGFRVQDNGCGIPKSMLKRVLEPFFTTKEVGKGTGLGLSSALGITKQHGGFLEIESVEGSGTCVSVLLPYSPDAGDPALDGEDVVEASPRGEGRILLADDYALVRRSTTNLLQRKGYQVLTADDGVEAIRAFEEDPFGFDLLVLDVVMPGMGGHKVLRRARQVRPHMPCLFITGHSEALFQESDGCDPELVKTLDKPFRPRDLLNAVERILGYARESGDDPTT